MKPPEMPFPPRSAESGPLKAVFVRRLERLVRLRREYDADLNPLGVQLLDHAIYATYRDCIDNGATEEVHALMGEVPEDGAAR